MPQRGAGLLGAVVVAASAVACGAATEPVDTPDGVATTTAAFTSTAATTTGPRVARKPRRGGQVIRELAGVAIGDPIEKAIRTVMGDPAATSSRNYRENAFEKEVGEWRELGYHVEGELPFLIGFDKAYTFDSPQVPIYMLFTKAERVVLIRASAYVTSEAEQRKIRIVDGCGLNSAGVCTELTFLDPALVQAQPSFGREIHHWVQHGVSMTVESGSVRVIDVYGDIDPDAQAKMEVELRKPTPMNTYYE